MIKVDFFYIMIGIFIGVFLIYVTSSPPKVVLKYPTINNINDTVYIDEKGQCYKYYAVEVQR